MTQLSTATAKPEVLMFHAANVTGTQELPIEVVPGLSVRSVTDSIAHRMALPGDVPWSLRDDGSSTYLDENRPIGDQIEPGTHLTITPKTHLGGRGCPVV
jgi:hypothetical protein